MGIVYAAAPPPSYVTNEAAHPSRFSTGGTRDPLEFEVRAAHSSKSPEVRRVDAVGRMLSVEVGQSPLRSQVQRSWVDHPMVHRNLGEL